MLGSTYPNSITCLLLAILDNIAYMLTQGGSTTCSIDGLQGSLWIRI